MRAASRQSLPLPLRIADKVPGKRLAVIAILLPALAISSLAKAEVFVSRYSVTLSGLPVGQAVLQATLSAKHYEVMISADVGTLIESTQIHGTASGSRAGVNLTPEHFRIVLTGGEEGAIDVNFAGGAGSGGTAATVNPRLRGVFDPLSALLVTSLKPSSPSKNPCTSVIPIFTGHARFDLNLHPKATASAEKEPAFVICQAEFGGGLAQEKLNMEIAFTKVPKPHFWLVEHLSLPTPKGTVTIDRAETTISGS